MKKTTQVFSASRRRLLTQLAAGIPVSLGLGSNLIATPAQAQSGEYRALVCVYLYGGNDGLNMVPPAAAGLHQDYAAVRGALAIPRAQVVPLVDDYGLHPSMTPLKDVFDNGRLAVINNVGPLSRPVTQAQYFDWQNDNNNQLVPDSLFSHKDQQILWANGASDALLRTGWGGRLMDAVAPGTPVYSFAGNSRFGAASLINDLVLPGPGEQLGLYGFNDNSRDQARLAALQALVGGTHPNLLQNALANSQLSAFETSARLGALLSQAPENGSPDPNNPVLSASFGHLAGARGNPLSRQLYQVAKMIKNRSVVGGNRHIYFVALGGFDHHANQLDSHAGLLAMLGQALSDFDGAMQALGTGNQVTLFTESDFGRTFKPNSSAGTDHAWGNTHLVMGGSVNGGRTWGDAPELLLGGPNDAGQHAWEHHGRWIPGFSVDQYAATLMDWFSQGGVDARNVLPNLSQFPSRNLGFMT